MTHTKQLLLVIFCDTKAGNEASYRGTQLSNAQELKGTQSLRRFGEPTITFLSKKLKYPPPEKKG